MAEAPLRDASRRRPDWLRSFAVCALLGCGGGPCGKASVGQATQVPEAQARRAEPPPAEPPPYQPKPGFRELAVEDVSPACVFPSIQAWFEPKLLRDVGKQRLRAGDSVVIGVFGPWCVNEACDQRPSLQCKVERQGETLILTSRFWGEHKDGASCTTDCRSITASCETPPLEAGEYTVRHGAESFTFRVPSLLTEPCFGSERPPPAPPAPPPP